MLVAGKLCRKPVFVRPRSYSYYIFRVGKNMYVQLIGASKAQNIYHPTLHRKCLLTSVLDILTYLHRDTFNSGFNH